MTRPQTVHLNTDRRCGDLRCCTDLREPFRADVAEVSLAALPAARTVVKLGSTFSKGIPYLHAAKKKIRSFPSYIFGMETGPPTPAPNWFCRSGARGCTVV